MRNPNVLDIEFEDAKKETLGERLRRSLEDYRLRTTRGEKLRNTALAIGAMATTVFGAKMVIEEAPAVVDEFDRVFHDFVLEDPDCTPSGETFDLLPGDTLWGAANELSSDDPTRNVHGVIDEIYAVNEGELGDPVQPGTYNVPVCD